MSNSASSPLWRKQSVDELTRDLPCRNGRALVRGASSRLSRDARAARYIRAHMYTAMKHRAATPHLAAVIRDWSKVPIGRRGALVVPLVCGRHGLHASLSRARVL